MSRALLEVQDLEKRYGGVRAVAGCSFALEPHSITGLIGPNGSGKTTLFKLISGEVTPSQGKILFKGKRVNGVAPHICNRMGIGRTFQETRVFHELTVLENVLAASRDTSFQRATKRALDLLDMVNLGAKGHLPASQLSYGQRKLLELVRLLMLDLDLLLLDEPFAGINRTLAVELAGFIRKLWQGGKTVVIIDHEMSIIMDLCRDLLVLDQGQILTAGDPVTVRNDPRVLAAYLGS